METNSNLGGYGDMGRMCRYGGVRVGWGGILPQWCGGIPPAPPCEINLENTYYITSRYIALHMWWFRSKVMIPKQHVMIPKQKVMIPKQQVMTPKQTVLTIYNCIMISCCFKMMLGWYWDVIGMSLGCCWDALRWCWDDFGMMLASLWPPFKIKLISLNTNGNH